MTQYDDLIDSFDVGPVHIIGLSTEFYFFIKYGTKQIERQRDWLEKDLQVSICDPYIGIWLTKRSSIFVKDCIKLI